MSITDASSVIGALPGLPGVYRFHAADNKVLYVGKALNIKKRVASYFHKTRQSPRIALMLNAADSLDAIVTASEAEALLLENNLIKSLKPRYNIVFRDDKSYPFLCISRHPYPRLMFKRSTAKKEDADYFGPFPDSAAVRQTIALLQRLFRLRTCTDNVLATRSRPCLLHDIGRCSAPCVNKIGVAEYAADGAQARRLLNGGASPLADALRTQMETAANEQNFEEAATLRDRLRALAVVRSQHFAEDADETDADYVGVYHDDKRACVNIVMVRGGRRIGERRLFPEHTAGGGRPEIINALLAQHYRLPPTKIFIDDAPADWREAAPHLHDHVIAKPRGEARKRVRAASENARQALHVRAVQQPSRRHRLTALAKRLTLAKPPRRMECFDISHSMGEETVAARAVFIDGAPQRREYRLYRIKTAAPGDDPAAIYEAVQRCYRRAVDENLPLPDLLLLDGGAGQVAAGNRALAELFPDGAPMPLFGVAKGAARRPGEETIIAADGETLNLPATDAALHLIQAVRDEAHRFAIDGHRRRRDKKRRTSSVLDGIEGVGDKKRRLLITSFGGLNTLRAASIGDLVKIDGIGTQLAARIYHALHR